MNVLTVLDLLGLNCRSNKDLKLSVAAGRKGLSREIGTSYVNRPGLALSGFFDQFAHDRIQIFGRGELAYLKKMSRDERKTALEKLFAFPIPCCIITSEYDSETDIVEIGEKHNVPILKTELNSSDFSQRIVTVLGDYFAPSEIIHATLVEVYGIGVLLQGDSGIGKSETALELISRGHRLIADDAVKLFALSGEILMGAGANEVTRHHLEVRGLGILNINHLFGVGAIREKKQIQLIIHMEEWNSQKNYDRFGAQDVTKTYLGIDTPFIEMPVKSGRNIPVLVEIAAMNERLKKLGYNSAREFNENMLEWLENKRTRDLYFKNEDQF